MSSTYWLGVVFAGVVVFTVFVRMRNARMKERYATWWLVIAGASAFFSLIPGALKAVSTFVGVEVPLNLGFFVSGIVLLLLSLRLSVDLSQASEERRRLAEEIALLRCDIENLRATVDDLASTQEPD